MVSSRDIITFSLPMIGFSVSYTAMMNLDILFVKSLVENQNMVGYYTAARALSSIVFGIVAVLSFTLLPSISRSYAKNNISQVRSYINESMRYLLIILFPTGVLSVFDSNGEQIPELQGTYSIDKHKRILLEAMDECKYEGFNQLRDTGLY